LIQSFATAVSHYLFQQAAYVPYVVRQRIELRQLSLRQSLPSHGSLRDVAETEEQLPDFVQRKPELPGGLNDRQSIEGCIVVSPLPTRSPGSRK
jgi:hypothetical protein